MATMQIKRGQSQNLPSVTLVAGEFAFSLDTGKLYIGNGTDKILINPDVITALEASKLSTPRNIAVSGAITGTSAFDGSKDINIITALSDSGVLEGQYTKLTVNAQGIVTSAQGLSASDIPTITSAKISDLGTAATKNVGTSSGNIPILDSNGKLSEGVIPASAITDVFVVNSEAAMLALTAQRGDVAVRTDVNRNYILKQSPANIVANWQELLTPSGGVTTVNGKTGVVVLTAEDLNAVIATRTINSKPLSTDIVLAPSDIGLGNVTNESKATMFTNPTFTGNAKAVTVDKTDNSTNIATTAFVKTQDFLSASSTIDGGTF